MASVWSNRSGFESIHWVWQHLREIRALWPGPITFTTPVAGKLATFADYVNAESDQFGGQFPGSDNAQQRFPIWRVENRSLPMGPNLRSLAPAYIIEPTHASPLQCPGANRLGNHKPGRLVTAWTPRSIMKSSGWPCGASN